MSLVVTSDDKGIKVFRRDAVSKAGNPYTQYSLSINQKQKDGSWANGYLPCLFKTGVSVNNKAVIKIKNAFYIVNKYNDSTTLKLMVTDFDVLDEGEKPVAPNEDITASDGFMNIAEGMPELPFQ